MDYKEKYEEALEGIQEILSSGEDSIKMSRLQLRLQGIFPELRKVEDEEVRKAMIDFFKHEREEGITVLHYGVDIERMIDWLERKGERKPAWSERDNKMLGEAIFHIEETIKYRTNKAILASANDVLSWLKLLKGRMTWKPSGEQMNSILCAVKKMKESACYDSELVSLFNDLKKLKG